MADAEIDKVLDCRGMQCPMPVVRTAKEMAGLTPGQLLELRATDRGAISDIPAWAEDTGNELVSSTDEDGELTFVLRKGEGAD